MIVHTANYIQSHPFALALSSLDPKLTNDGKPYGPVRYRQLVKENYIITRQVNTSYIDVLKMMPQDKKIILKEIIDEIDARNKAYEEMRMSTSKD